MSHESWSWRLTKVIRSDLQEGHHLLDLVLRQLQRLNWSDHDLFAVQLSLEEALVNAIKHGNQCDCSKQVHVVCKVSPDRLWVEIRDEGPGFNPCTLPDPTSPENLELPTGRGIMLMRNFMTRVEYNTQGNCVVMEKERAKSA